MIFVKVTAGFLADSRSEISDRESRGQGARNHHETYGISWYPGLDKEDFAMPTILERTAVLATIVAIGAATGALAQEPAADPHHPDAAATETAPPTGAADTAEQIQGAQPGQPGMMPPGMMDPGMMQEMMSGMMQPGMRGAMPGMHGHMMKVVFAIADADGDGGLSLEEIADIQQRVFNAVDADDDGRVTPEELQAFMRE